MTQLSIKLAGDPSLHRISRCVDPQELKTSQVQQALDDLIDTLQFQGGVGIAANQLGMPWRIIVLHINEERAKREGCSPLPFTVLINPQLEILDLTMITGPEGCFSLPSLIGKVPRYQKVKYKALDRRGSAIEGIAEFFLARVLQHEVDHLDGILYWTHIHICSHFGFIKHIPGLQDPRKLPS